MAVLRYHTHIKKVTIISYLLPFLSCKNVVSSIRSVVLWAMKVLNNKLNQDFTKQLLSKP